MNTNKKAGGFLKFFIIYTVILCLLALAALFHVNSLLKNFEASQPERVVERQIELLKIGAREGRLEEVMPIPEETSKLIGSDKYPMSYVKCIAETELTYEQAVGSYGAEFTIYNILSDGKHIASVELDSSNERTEMIVFTCADWALKDIFPVAFEGEFTVPSSIKVTVNGEAVTGVADENGNTAYSLALMGDADVELSDIFGNSEKQRGKVRKHFSGGTFTVPSAFTVNAGNAVIPSECITTAAVPEFEYVSMYTSMPYLSTYNIRYIPTDSENQPEITILDNLGQKVPYSFGDQLNVTKLSALPEVPAALLQEADVLGFAEKWSLFMTNDLSGGLGAISIYLIKDSYIYSVAYKWATGIDRTFTSIHRLYDPPFTDEKVSNYVRYSDNCFSCDVYLVKKMRIANGLDVDDELSRKLFFVKYDSTNDGKDNPRWMVADMLGADYDKTAGGEENE